jgi:type III restriction enzyme
MKIQFDSNQSYQLDAINAIVDVFEGQPLAQGQFEVSLSAEGELLGEPGRGNRLTLSDAALLANVQKVQEHSGLPVSEALDGLNFTVEMETGTGKTYVYLRTLYELHARYGFSKFIIVVPSIAIREGVMTSLRLMADHFKALYDNTPCDAWVYDSRRVSSVRQFAQSNTLQILILNIQAFATAANIMNRDNDRLSGRKPIEFLQAANPVVILDEPQNMETETAKQAIASLNPLCTLRYSATHRNLYNLVHRLGPVQAYDLSLVKRIVVDSVVEEGDFNRPFIQVEEIRATRTAVTAKLRMDVQTPGGVARRSVTVNHRDDLKALSGGREVYDGYIVEEIRADDNRVYFDNGISLAQGEAQDANKDAIMKMQVHETVKEHLDKELRVRQQLPEGRRVKVLSLFFIDRVANYAREEGKIRRWFAEAYEELSRKPRYAPLSPLPVEQVHDGYFAEERGIAKDSREGYESQADDAAFRKIMRGKEQLLDMNEPLRFIFSHSALREGWDNPNVFQICTLNETRSEMKKRQEIGRGLRLPVDETGNRVFDPAVNRLTVIANESYNAFAKALQTEIEEETGEKFQNRIANARERRKAELIPGWREHREFVELWERIKHRTRYSVDYDTAKLIALASDYLRKLPEIAPPSIHVEQHEVRLTGEGLKDRLITAHDEKSEYRTHMLPDILSYLQRETRLTRGTLAQILTQSGRLKDALTNPQQLLDQATRAIKQAKHDLMIDGIKYERVVGPDGAWDMMLFEINEINSFVSRLMESGKSLYDVIECESDTERRFAAGLESRGDIRFFLKLPRWFKIETPLGTYNPDWAVIKQRTPDDAKLYLVRETKSTTEQFAIRPTEEAKITCGKAHFAVLPGVDFKKVTDPAKV